MTTSLALWFVLSQPQPKPLQPRLDPSMPSPTTGKPAAKFNTLEDFYGATGELPAAQPTTTDDTQIEWIPAPEPQVKKAPTTSSGPSTRR
jgi:hypothetical protein